jgi:hypothetical protein
VELFAERLSSIIKQKQCQKRAQGAGLQPSPKLRLAKQGKMKNSRTRIGESTYAKASVDEEGEGETQGLNDEETQR